MSENTEITVVNNSDENRFEVRLGDALAVIEYNIAGNNIIFTHTEVPVEFEGKGIAGKMAYAAMEYAKNSGMKVQALCPYVKNYVTKHPEYHDITWGFEQK